jgi:acetyl esterase/lipase
MYIHLRTVVGLGTAICILATAATICQAQPAASPASPAASSTAARPTRGIQPRQLAKLSLDVDQLAESNDGVIRLGDVIYGRKFGMALTMDVLRPSQPNGAAVVWAVSGGFYSSHDQMSGPGFVKYVGALLERGYTVFAVVHGSNPKFDMREVSADMHRAVRFIRHNAQALRIDPNRIGISGASAGGSIALWLGTRGGPGDANAEDPVDRASSQVQAVACFYPGVDWVHWEKDGSNNLATSRRLGLIDAFRFRDFDPVKKEYVEETDPNKINAILAEYSPINHVSAKSAPTLILQGDKDALVRLEPVTAMIDKLKQAGVPAQLVVKEGKGHSWPGQDQDIKLFADWYDKYLLGVATAGGVSSAPTTGQAPANTPGAR